MTNHMNIYIYIYVYEYIYKATSHLKQQITMKETVQWMPSLASKERPLTKVYAAIW